MRVVIQVLNHTPNFPHERLKPDSLMTKQFCSKVYTVWTPLATLRQRQHNDGRPTTAVSGWVCELYTSVQHQTALLLICCGLVVQLVVQHAVQQIHNKSKQVEFWPRRIHVVKLALR